MVSVLILILVPLSSYQFLRLLMILNFFDSRKILRILFLLMLFVFQNLIFGISVQFNLLVI